MPDSKTEELSRHEWDDTSEHHFEKADLVRIGFVALAFAAVEYRQSVRVLSEEFGHSPRSKSVILGALIALLGIFALFSMIF